VLQPESNYSFDFETFVFTVGTAVCVIILCIKTFNSVNFLIVIL